VINATGVHFATNPNLKSWLQAIHTRLQAKHSYIADDRRHDGDEHARGKRVGGAAEASSPRRACLSTLAGSVVTLSYVDACRRRLFSGQ
jgi:hypothetical protein